MNRHWPALLLCLILVVAFDASAELQRVPDPPHVEITIATDLPLTLYCLPDGSGNPFTRAADEQGNLHDATITFKVMDYADGPVVGLPAEDMWLETSSESLHACLHGNIADSPTDADGKTQWVQPLHAGGFSLDADDQCCIYLCGNVLWSEPALTLYFNSADINGNGVVDILDIAAFQGLSRDGYHRAIDLQFDGVIDILDVTRMSTAWLIGCE